MTITTKRRRTAFTVVPAALAAAALVFTGCAGGNGGSGDDTSPNVPDGKFSPEIQKLIDGANKEGGVGLFIGNDSRTEEQAQQLADGMKKTFGVDLKVEFVQGDRSSAATVARLKQEAQAGVTSNLDVLMMDPLYLPELTEAKVTKDVDWAALDGVKKDDVWDKYGALEIYEIARSVMYNTDVIKKEDAPKSADELVTSKWANDVVSTKVAYTYSPFAYEWGEEKTIDFVKKAIPAWNLVPSSIAIRTPVSSGEFPIGFGVRIGAEQRENNAPVAYAPIKVPVVPRVGMVMASSERSNAAELMLYWFNTTDEGKKLAYEVLDWARHTNEGTDLYEMAQLAGGVIQPDHDWWLNEYPVIQKKVAAAIDSL